MDTRFWGPSGWQFLHLVAAGGEAKKEFWNSLPYILPCKFCRASLTQYYIDHPIPTDKKKIEKWLWTIHNEVNAKLRGQGQSIPPDPPFSEVKKLYQEKLAQGCTKTVFPGWDFFFSIADNHPSKSPYKPMPDVTEEDLESLNSMTIEEKNRKNLLSVKERTHALIEFWKHVPTAMPFKEWQKSWKEHVSNVETAMKSRKTALAWLWKIRCGMDEDLEKLGITFHGLCKEVAKHRSGCASSKRARTCRRSKKNRNNTRKNR